LIQIKGTVHDVETQVLLNSTTALRLLGSGKVAVIYYTLEPIRDLILSRVLQEYPNVALQEFVCEGHTGFVLYSLGGRKYSLYELMCILEEWEIESST